MADKLPLKARLLITLGLTGEPNAQNFISVQDHPHKATLVKHGAGICLNLILIGTVF